MQRSEGISPRLQVVQTIEEDPTCKTFVMFDEDHTLGNTLRYIIMKNPDVEFCGYTIPHPLENKIHFRIQTHGAPAQDVLRKGLVELKDVCAHIKNSFEMAAVEASSQPAPFQTND